MRKVIIFMIPFILCGGGGDKRKILMIIAHKDFRDEELLIPKARFGDEGYDVIIASSDTSKAKGMLGATVKPDILIRDASDSGYVALVLAGGVGAKALFADTILHKLIRSFYHRNKLVAAICLAPIILGRSGILEGKKATVWSGDKDAIIALGVDYQPVDVVADSMIVTGSGPKAAKKFADKILGILK